MCHNHRKDVSGSTAKTDDFSEATNAKANLLKQQRLTNKQKTEYRVGKQAAALENKMPKTQEALSTLGAGRPFNGTQT